MKFKGKCQNCGKALFRINKFNWFSNLGKDKVYCRSCAMSKVWELDRRKDGIRKQPISYCIDCGIKTQHKYSKRCQKCHLKFISSLGTSTHKKDCKCVKCYKRIGKEAPNWIDGRSYKPYPYEFNNEIRDKIRKRDSFVCQKCNITEEEHLTVYGKNLAIHHINYDKTNNNDTNLITLCIECNARVNYNRDYWTTHFKNKLEEMICKNTLK
jgi:hypothetical protein